MNVTDDAPFCKCGYRADPDDQCVVVILGEPMCSACAQQKAEEQEDGKA